MIQYETERLYLRNYRMEDIPDFYAYMSLPFTALHEVFEPASYEKCEQVVQRRLTDDAHWMVQLKENGKVIGNLNFGKAAHDAIEIGYDFHEAYGKKGYATEACQVLLRHLFLVVGARRIIAECNEGNTASWRLMERLGMRREGYFIEDAAFKRDATGNPIYINSYLYALLRREWLAQHPECAE